MCWDRGWHSVVKQIKGYNKSGKMFCTQCGTKLDDAARFCTLCGKPTSVLATAPPLPRLEPNPATAGFYPAAVAKRLRRILREKKIAGVCAGYAEYFNMDVTLMRLIWVGLLIMPPSIGLVAYIISWIVLPTE
jgi:phage shock protein C